RSRRRVPLLTGARYRLSWHKHVWRYTGHCSQLKFHFAKSYGKLTGELLIETHSDHLQVLSAESNTSHPPIGGKDLNRIIPGYMVYIYIVYIFIIPRHLLAQRPEPPLRAISGTLPSYKSLNPFIPPGKPYQMEDEHPQKYFISGFTGHVPNSRFLFGKGYPAIANKALIEYGKQQRSQKTKGEKQTGKAPSGSLY
ncbi:ciliary microtubule inner protein 2B, partial [Austrofundulus limnaeus]|uniref:Ciliary microtubule inner protein 2B n=1 Tax=Austrofundulus limnaeus TaxID=52670 RepID=A0A2I4AUF7_AUSLI